MLNCGKKHSKHQNKIKISCENNPNIIFCLKASRENSDKGRYTSLLLPFCNLWVKLSDSHLESQHLPYRISQISPSCWFSQNVEKLCGGGWTPRPPTSNIIKPVSSLVEGVEGDNFVPGTGRYEAINVRDLTMWCSVGHIDAEIHRKFATSIFVKNMSGIVRVLVCLMWKKVWKSNGRIHKRIHCTLTAKQLHR